MLAIDSNVVDFERHSVNMEHFVERDHIEVEQQQQHNLWLQSIAAERAVAAVEYSYLLVQRHNYSVSLAVADMAGMDLVPALALVLAHTYSVEWVDTHLAVDNLVNIVVNAAVAFANLQTPDMNRCVELGLDIRVSLILVHNIRFLLFYT